MKKIIVLALAVMMVVSALALTACAPQTVRGTWKGTGDDASYGCIVDVTVAGGKIVEVKLLTDAEAAEADAEWDGRTLQTVIPGKTWTQVGGDADAPSQEVVNKWVSDTFVGKTVDEVKALTNDTIKSDDYKLTDSTTSGTRVLAAVLDALSKLDK